MADVRYLNIDIRVVPGADGALRVLYIYPGVEPASGLERAYRPPEGYETSLSGRRPDRHTWRRAPGAEAPDGAASLKALQAAGEALYTALIPTEAEALLSLAEAVETPVRVRVRIDLTRAPELSTIPWEALYRKTSNKLLATTVNTTVVRLLDPDDQQVQTPVEGALRVLIAVAIPHGDLAGDVEIANIRRRVDQLSATGAGVARLEIQTLEQTGRKSLRQKLFDFRPHVIHYIGHGEFRDGRGYLLLHDERDPEKPDFLDAGALADLAQNDRPILVVLNTCQGATADLVDPFAGSAQSLIRSNIPYVVAMQTAISDDAAITFSEELYSVLVAGEPIDAAVSRGRNAIRLMAETEAQTELITPVLYCSGRIGPLVAPARAEPPVAPPAAGTPSPAPPPPVDRHPRRIGLTIGIAASLVMAGAVGALLVMRSPASLAPSPTVDRQQSGSGLVPIEASPVQAGAAPPRAASPAPAPVRVGAAPAVRRPHVVAAGPAPAPVEPPPYVPEEAGEAWPLPVEATDHPPAPVFSYAEEPGLALPPVAAGGSLVVTGRDPLQAPGDSVGMVPFSGSLYATPATDDRWWMRIIRGLSAGSTPVAPYASPRRGVYAVVTWAPYGVEAPPASYFFESGSTEALAPQDLPARTALWLAAQPPVLALRVVGHADRPGATDYNDQLSLARAVAVADLLVAAGTPADRLTVTGAGSRAALQATADAGARRVDVEVVLTGAESVTVRPDGLAADAGPALDRMAAWLDAAPEMGLTLRSWPLQADPVETAAALAEARREQVRAALIARGVEPARLHPTPPQDAGLPGVQDPAPNAGPVDLVLEP